MSDRPSVDPQGPEGNVRPPGTALPKLALRQVGRAFGDVVAVEGLTLEIWSGEFVSLLGPSGCGKTTTLRMIAGFVTPTHGTIEMDGATISSHRKAVPPERREMSIIFQSYALWPHMTVAENVAFGLKLRRLDRGIVRQKVAEILTAVHLEKLAQRYPPELSGGEQQRVALARAIVVRPSVLLMDEPLSNLDASLREEMRLEIRRLHDEFRITTVFVTHDQSEAIALSDRIAIMNQGRIEQIGAPFELYTRPKTRFVAGFVGKTNFVEGACAGDQVVVGGVAIARRRFEDGGQAFATKVLFSLCPQHITLHRERPTSLDGDRCVIEGRVVERSYLGDAWEYGVTLRASALRLRVTTLPLQVFEIDEHVWLDFDPQHLVAVA